LKLMIDVMRLYASSRSSVRSAIVRTTRREPHPRGRSDAQNCGSCAWVLRKRGGGSARFAAEPIGSIRSEAEDPGVSPGVKASPAKAGPASRSGSVICSRDADPVECHGAYHHQYHVVWIPSTGNGSSRGAEGVSGGTAGGDSRVPPDVEVEQFSVQGTMCIWWW